MKTRSLFLFVALIHLIGAATTQHSHAQLSGDELRGAGAYLRGAGWYNLNTAKATSINVDSVIRWKADLRKIQAERRLLVAKSKADKKAKIEEIKQNLLRREYELRTNPSASDVHKGDALDVLLYDLTDPGLSLGVWQGSPVELPDGMSVKELIFQFTPLSGSSSASTALGRGVIALSRLDIEGNWPTSLRGAELVSERTAFEHAYKTVRDDVIAGKLDLRSLAQLDNSLDGLKEKVKEVLPEERGYRTEGTRFVEDLRAATRMFDAATVDYAREILIDTKDHDAKTVGELVAFMSKYRLQFASAERHPAQRELYAKLYQAMRLQAEKFGLKATEPVEPSPPSHQSGVRFELGNSWKGVTRSNRGFVVNTMWSVVKRDGDKLTFMLTHSNGVINEYDCQLTSDKEFTLIDARRVKLPRGYRGPPSVSGTAGTGSATEKSFTATWTWPADKSSWSFIGSRVE